MEKKISKKSKIAPQKTDAALIGDIRSLIEQTRGTVAQTVNSALVLMNWHIGKRINDEILKNKRADYGKEIVATLSQQLTADYGRGFSRPNLFKMVQFAEQFPDFEIVSSLSRQLSWTHFSEILPVKNELARQFYAEMCRLEGWSVRTLRERINSMLFERTAISRKPEETIKQDLAALQSDSKLTPDLVFRDPYFLDFLDLKDAYSERDLETAILREIERFLLEMGTGFAFVARQKRIVIDGEDFYIDLLLYHRGLQCLVNVELKIGKFEAAHKGQMELYLRWLDKYERLPHENPPLGLLLCTEAKTEQVELLRLTDSGIRIAEYLTELPPLKLLEEKLRAAVEKAKEK
jgi:predicted nuclease of restriction endonuclease-like (RecB) superfamily